MKWARVLAHPALVYEPPPAAWKPTMFDVLPVPLLRPRRVRRPALWPCLPPGENGWPVREESVAGKPGQGQAASSGDAGVVEIYELAGNSWSGSVFCRKECIFLTRASAFDRLPFLREFCPTSEVYFTAFQRKKADQGFCREGLLIQLSAISNAHRVKGWSIF